MAVTMQDVADAAGVSRTTVSIVINGKQSERKIPQQTCNKIYDAMQKLGYQVNISAKRLRRSEQYIPIIVLLCPDDQRATHICRTINGINRFAEETGFECETVIQTYKSSELKQQTLDFIQCNYNGIIAYGLSDKDVKVFENADIRTPVVLINKESKKYPTVSLRIDTYVDRCLDLFSKKGYDNVGILIPQKPHSYAIKRAKLFHEKASALGLQITQFKFDTPDYIRGGMSCAEQFLSMESQHIKGIYSDSDLAALGFMHVCSRKGLKIPQNFEIISMGFLPEAITKCYNPSLSVLDMPLEKMTYTAVKIIAELFKNKNKVMRHYLFEPDLIIRDSFKF